jgi:hypothetical protein
MERVPRRGLLRVYAFFYVKVLVDVFPERAPGAARGRRLAAAASTSIGERPFSVSRSPVQGPNATRAAPRETCGAGCVARFFFLRQVPVDVFRDPGASFRADAGGRAVDRRHRCAAVPRADIEKKKLPPASGRIRVAAMPAVDGSIAGVAAPPFFVRT